MPTDIVIPSKTLSTTQTQVEGDIKIRVLIIIIVGILLSIMLIGGVVGLICDPASFGQYWNTILPVISGAVFGFVGFIVGRKIDS
jgi:hypothetical protein